MAAAKTTAAHGDGDDPVRVRRPHPRRHSPHCNCSFYEPDDGSEGGPTNARYTPYSGVYRKHYTLDQETA